ncbi:MAG: alpha/beta fold hydrolase [Candidatus Kariarchaeaceae archaeon]|jgi:pimeloyl-ACP methyl ester carboxylesterase
MPYVNNRGTKIFYQVEGNGSPLVMLPGGVSTHESFFEFGYVDALRATHKLILIDMRGRGQSDKPHQADGYSFKLMVEDIITVLNDLEIDSCHFYGHSMGGWEVVGVARYFPERLKSIILSDGVAGSGDPEYMQNLVENFDEIVSNWEISQASKERIFTTDRHALKAIADWCVKEIPFIIKEISSTIDKINVPTLILMSNMGEDAEEYQILKKAESVISGSRLIHFEDLNHGEIFRHSDRILPYIKEFLSSI